VVFEVPLRRAQRRRKYDGFVTDEGKVHELILDWGHSAFLNKKFR
jgi:hypothetical protein